MRIPSVPVRRPYLPGRREDRQLSGCFDRFLPKRCPVTVAEDARTGDPRPYTSPEAEESRSCRSSSTRRPAALTGEFAHLMEGGERDINGAVRTLRSSPLKCPRICQAETWSALDIVKRRREQKFGRVSASSASVTAIHCPRADGNGLSVFREHGSIQIFLASHSRSFDHRRFDRPPLIAIARAFRCPTRTTRRLPRVTPV